MSGFFRRCAAELAAHIEPSAVLQQQLYGRRIPLTYGHMQGCFGVLGRTINVGTVLKQYFSRREIAARDCDVKWRFAAGPNRVDCQRIAIGEVRHAIAQSIQHLFQ